MSAAVAPLALRQRERGGIAQASCATPAVDSGAHLWRAVRHVGQDVVHHQVPYGAHWLLSDCLRRDQVLQLGIKQVRRSNTPPSRCRVFLTTPEAGGHGQTPVHMCPAGRGSCAATRRRLRPKRAAGQRSKGRRSPWQALLVRRDRKRVSDRLGASRPLAVADLRTHACTGWLSTSSKHTYVHQVLLTLGDQREARTWRFTSARGL